MVMAVFVAAGSGDFGRGGGGGAGAAGALQVFEKGLEGVDAPTYTHYPPCMAKELPDVHLRDTLAQIPHCK